MIDFDGLHVYENGKILFPISKIKSYSKTEWICLGIKKSKILKWKGRKFKVWYMHSGQPFQVIEIDC